MLVTTNRPWEPPTVFVCKLSDSDRTHMIGGMCLALASVPSSVIERAADTGLAQTQTHTRVQSPQSQ